MEEELKQRLDRIDTKLSLLLQEKKKATTTWVKVSTVMALTGWNRYEMQRMRKFGIVQYKKDKGGFWYLLESINPIFVKGKLIDNDKKGNFSNEDLTK